MGAFRFADPSAIKRVAHPSDSNGWVDLRETLSKREMNSILNALPPTMFEKDSGENVRFTFQEGAGMAEALFTGLVRGWSLGDNPTKESYLDLDVDSGTWIDGVLADHFQNLQVSRQDENLPSGSQKASRKD